MRRATILSPVQRPVKGPDVIGQHCWLLHRGEVPAPRHYRPALQIVGALRPTFGWRGDFPRKDRNRGGRFNPFARLEPERMVQLLVVEADRRTDRAAYPVNHYVGKQLIPG